MSPLPFFQRHPRADLSVHLDGELTAARARRLVAHLADCPACAREIEALREARSALRSLPEAAAPRSFALTPEMVRAHAPAAPRRGLQPLVNSLRLTSGGLAVALAVAVVLAVSGGNNTSSSGAPEAARSSDQYAAAAPYATQAFSGNDLQSLPSPAPTSEVVADSNNPAGVGSGPVATPGEGNLGSVAAPSPADEQQSSGDDSQKREELATQDAGKPAPGGVSVPESSGAEIPVPATGVSGASGSGIGAWTVVAIALAVLLAGALIGSIAAQRLARDRM